MSEIKLTADSGGGTTSLKAPSTTTSNADVVLKLPVADGSSGQVLKTDGSGQLSFTSNAGTTINNNANNRVITGSGSANTLEGESNLTFTGSILTVTNSSGASELTLVTPSNTDGGVYFNDGTNSGAVSYQHSDNSMRFRVNATEKMRILSGGGITFNGDTATANALDDYEEGTFTPAFTQGYAYVNTITYSQQVGHYTKIGNQVFAYVYMRQTGNSSHSGNIITDGNSLQIGGLPYTAANLAYTDGGGYLTYTNGFFGTSVSSEVFHAMPWVGANSSSVSFHKPSSGNNIVGNDTTPTNKFLVFHVRYRAS